jgi:hypothetical protein
MFKRRLRKETEQFDKKLAYEMLSEILGWLYAATDKIEDYGGAYSDCHETDKYEVESQEISTTIYEEAASLINELAQEIGVIGLKEHVKPAKVFTGLIFEEF